MKSLLKNPPSEQRKPTGAKIDIFYGRFLRRVNYAVAIDPHEIVSPEHDSPFNFEAEKDPERTLKTILSREVETALERSDHACWSFPDPMIRGIWTSEHCQFVAEAVPEEYFSISIATLDDKISALEHQQRIDSDVYAVLRKLLEDSYDEMDASLDILVGLKRLKNVGFQED